MKWKCRVNNRSLSNVLVSFYFDPILEGDVSQEGQKSISHLETNNENIPMNTLSVRMVLYGNWALLCISEMRPLSHWASHLLLVLICSQDLFR